MRLLKSILIGAAGLTAIAPAPSAATVFVSVGAVGAATAALPGYTYGLANLDNAVNGLPTVSFAGSSVTGTTTNGFINIGGANVYGGAGGTGLFGTVNGSDATIQLSQSVDYFGLWGSALDGNNAIALYNDNTLLGTFALQSVLQNSAGFNNGYYGNPFAGGGNNGELYAFFNFQSDTAFNRVQIIQNGGGGFEFDNLTVGSKVVSAAPEPGTWAMMLLGFGAIGYLLRSGRRTKVLLAA